MLSRAILALVLSLAPAVALAQAKPAKPSTVTAAMPTPDERARQWLTLVDDGNYAQSWKDAAPAFHDHTTVARWIKKVTAERTPLGAVASRDLKSIDLSRANIAVVRYDSSFAHKTGATETVTLTFDKGSWSVSDYKLQ